MYIYICWIWLNIFIGMVGLIAPMTGWGRFWRLSSIWISGPLQHCDLEDNPRAGLLWVCSDDCLIIEDNPQLLFLLCVIDWKIWWTYYAICVLSPQVLIGYAREGCRRGFGSCWRLEVPISFEIYLLTFWPTGRLYWSPISLCCTPNLGESPISQCYNVETGLINPAPCPPL